MSTPDDKVRAVSDPTSPDYDPDSPHYDVTADSSSPFYVGQIENTALSGDQIRELVTMVAGPLIAELSERDKDAVIQRLYSDTLVKTREGLDEGLELRPKGEPPRTLWENASHEYMESIITTDADSAAIAETSEEWVRLGNELALHQKAIAEAIEDSMGNWSGEGGDAAREHLAEVARWLGRTAQGSVLTGRQQQIHSQTLNETQKQMAANPPVEFSLEEANARLQQITDPVQYALAVGQVSATVAKQNAAREQAARLMTQFDATIGAAVDMPFFTPPPKLGRAAGGGAGAASQPLLMSRKPLDATEANATRLAVGRKALGDQDGMEGSTPLDFESASGVNAAVLSGGLPTMSTQSALDIPGGATPGGPVQQGSTGYTPLKPGMPDFAGAAGGGVPGAGGSVGGGLPGNVPGAPAYDPSSFVPPSYDPPSYDPPSFDTPSFDRSSPGLPDYSGTSVSSFTNPDTQQVGGGRVPGMPWSPGTTGDSVSHRFGGPGSGLLPGSLPAFDPTSSPGLKTGGAGAIGGAGGGLPGGLPGGGAGGGGAGSAGAAAQNSGAGRALGAGEGAGRVAQPMPGQGRVAGGMPMAGGMPPAGGARQQEDDKEHRVAAYLTDEDGIFATEEVIAPPVIGDWSNKDWK